MHLAFFSGIGVWEILLALLVILLLFGAKKLPELSRSLGRSLSEFKKGRAEGEKMVAEGQSPNDATGAEAGSEDKKSS